MIKRVFKNNEIFKLISLKRCDRQPFIVKSTFLGF